jgi:chromosomal replication initiation ATPase DnaA
MNDLCGDNSTYIPSIIAIQKLVCDETGADLRDMLSARRGSKGLARARHIAMYLARKINGSSYESIGRKFGRHHTTIMHGENIIELLMVDDKNLFALICFLWKKIYDLPADIHRKEYTITATYSPWKGVPLPILTTQDQ